MVFYRKYRPQSIDQLDSSAVRAKLTAVLGNLKNVPHAFLFTGPKGLGKTSTARIIAKIVNCTADTKKRGKNGIEPCNECEQCISITNGSNMDVLEIDAASNRGIDEMRELKERINLAPLSAYKKVYIIDEVHMLTTEAFNALLKTLEEPPPHAMFILCTTEPQKVPATILSRTFHISLKKATQEELVRSFKRIILTEKIAISDDGLLRIAELSGGGFRDGSKILEEVAALSEGKPITTAIIDEKFHISGSTEHTYAIVNHLTHRETKELLTLVGTLVTDGSDLRYTLEQVITAFHDELLRQSGVQMTASGETTAKALSLNELKTLLNLLTKALTDMKYSVLPQLPFELAVIEWGEGEVVLKPPQSVESSANSESRTHSVGSQSGTATNEPVSVTSLRKHVGNVQKERAMYGEPKNTEEKKAPSGPPADVSALNFSATGEITPEWLQAFWLAIIQDIKQHNHTLAGVLRGCKIRSFDRKHLIIETAFSFHRDKLDNAQTKDILEQICHTLTGNPIKVTIELKAA